MMRSGFMAARPKAHNEAKLFIPESRFLTAEPLYGLHHVAFSIVLSRLGIFEFVSIPD
ncbi:hypothetical protein [Roseobacter fucihabitans]|uniref:hypothetical protein n=1 Tax=Roseobacter fucihabitans TaxID=1537242 RepID=UPI001CA344F8|nr:hypothetical protein [Roseobacter litoralis]